MVLLCTVVNSVRYLLIIQVVDVFGGGGHGVLVINIAGLDCCFVCCYVCLFLGSSLMIVVYCCWFLLFVGFFV